ncbi:hypothetical protein LXL04_025318 [Taraxacum kok-saghyz]
MDEILTSFHLNRCDNSKLLDCCDAISKPKDTLNLTKTKNIPKPRIWFEPPIDSRFRPRSYLAHLWLHFRLSIGFLLICGFLNSTYAKTIFRLARGMSMIQVRFLHRLSFKIVEENAKKLCSLFLLYDGLDDVKQ